MKISFDSRILDNEKLSLEEIELLHSLSIELDFKKTIESLLEKGLIGYKYKNNVKVGIFVLDKGVNLVEKIIIESDDYQPSKSRLENLAKSIQELFPSGKKEGTKYYWRGSEAEIVLRLRQFIKKFGDFPDDIIINATKKFVESYGSDRRFMPILKYFIWKNKRTSDGEGGEIIEQTSELLSYIENREEVKAHNWSVIR